MRDPGSSEYEGIGVQTQDLATRLSPCMPCRVALLSFSPPPQVTRASRRCNIACSGSTSAHNRTLLGLLRDQCADIEERTTTCESDEDHPPASAVICLVRVRAPFFLMACRLESTWRGFPCTFSAFVHPWLHPPCANEASPLRWHMRRHTLVPLRASRLASASH